MLIINRPNLAILLTLLFCLVPLSGGAVEKEQGISREQYEKMYNLSAVSSNEFATIKKCLDKFGDSHPFKDDKSKRFRVIDGSVKVLGIGGKVYDRTETSYPQLILVKPTVNVLTKSEFDLMNPNGWYCMKANVTVLSKNIVNLHCQARLATSEGDTVVMGSGESGTGGVTVLGKLKLNRIGCAE